MRLDNAYRLRSIAGENIVIKDGANDVNMTKVISLNSSSAWLWTRFEGEEFEESDIVSALCEKYAVDRSIAEVDVSRWLGILREHDIII